LRLAPRSFAADELDRFVDAYKHANGEIEKRTVCLNFIDAGLLYDGAPIADVRKVFQPDFEEMGMDLKSNRQAVVHFVPPKVTSSPLEPGVWTGWYLALTYWPDGTIMHYSLSNEDKDRTARLRLARKIREGRTNEEVGLPVVEIGTNSNGRAADGQRKGAQP
jgi:hypothetical protein